MKVKISITLSEELLAAIDDFSSRFNNRSEFIETAVRTYIAQLTRNEINARDLEIVNQQADQLNEEAADVLHYQAYH
jgi:metal-responsive CopG/Arc/MetJ family transcriptional regulator